MGSSFFLYFLGGIIALILSTIIIALIHPEDKLLRSLVLILSASLLFRSSEVIKYWFESKVLSRHVVILETGIYIFLAIVKLILIYTKIQTIMRNIFTEFKIKICKNQLKCQF